MPPLSPLAEWRRSHGLPSDGAGEGGDLADPDADGIPNLLEYALGSSPVSPASGRDLLPTVSLGPGQRPRLSFTRLREDLRYTVQASDDLASWETISVNPGAPGEAVTVSDTRPPQPRRFLRLLIQ